MIRFEDLLEKVRAYSPDADVELLRKAYVFSAFEHRGQVRHSGEPYLIHPLAVADFLADMKLDAVAIAAGLLHDVVEDTLTTIERITELFGPDVAHVVEGVTKISAIPFSSSEERQAENFRKMLLAMVDDIRVILVKLADRLHNMRTLSHLPDERRVKIAQETRDIYAPIANRLGMSKVKNELEELSFKYLEPQAYEALRARVDAKRRATEGLIGELKVPLNVRAAPDLFPTLDPAQGFIVLNAAQLHSLASTVGFLDGEFANELLSCAWRYQITRENRPYLIDVDIAADINPAGAGVWELPGLGQSRPSIGTRYEPG